MTRFALLLLFLCLILPAAYSQPEKRKIQAARIAVPPVIDGVLDEDVWKSAPPATGFIQYMPYNGRPSDFRTEVCFLYDNAALYVGAMMYDPHPDSILKQLGPRDATDLNADFMEVQVSPFNDGVNSFVFSVTASGVQTDYKMPHGQVSWDAVWVSQAKINQEGWVLELKIPYSAIRFPVRPVQEWGINVVRSVRRCREQSSFNLIDQKVDGIVNQEGLLEGVRDIEPPLRLALYPYISGYLEQTPGENSWDFSNNFGIDLKYGINESFTLDMTLIPDFGQVPSDDKIYNFTPFEIRYDEKRQFFTEGTELFNKGDIFYSRRVGGQPKGYNMVYDSLKEGEIVQSNPMQTRLINASKISGRTPKGLGIGFFNGMSANTWADVMDTVTGETRRILTQGFTNYNMIVFDQALKNNSWFDLMNTNYYMPTEGYTANVSGTDFKFANNRYTYDVTGNIFVSQKYHSHAPPEFGYHHSLNAGKIHGNFLFNLNQVLETEKYDPNDMGFNARNNKFNNDLKLQYNIYTPFGKMLNTFNTVDLSYNCLYDGLKYTSFEIHQSSNITTMRYLTLGLNTDAFPVDWHDYFEPRVPGYMYIAPAECTVSGWISTDYRKKLALDMNATYYIAPKNRSWGYAVDIKPRYRVSDRLFLIYEFNFRDLFNNIGYVMDSLDGAGNPVILFGKRDIRTITNTLTGNFMFNSKMSIDLRLRHYWVVAPYHEYYTLRTDGTLDPGDYSGDQDVNCNIFNIDLTYLWEFAPGSQLSVMWKNSVNTTSNDIDYNVLTNLNHTLTSPASNSFSIRLIYYLDAMRFKKKPKV
jgi:hypothetical protein